MHSGFSGRHMTAAIVVAWASAAHAEESEPIATPHATVTLVSETAAVEPGKPFRLGLRFKLAKGWHIYWTNPGAAGEPPRLDLALPEGAKASDMAWPTPERVRQSDEVMSYAYLDEVLLPVTVTPPAGVSAFPIKAKASWLICEKICVPEEGELTLDLPVGLASPSVEAPLFAAADARIPQPSADAATISARRRSHRRRRRPLARRRSRGLVPARVLGGDRRPRAAGARASRPASFRSL